MFGQLTFFSYFCAQIAREAARTCQLQASLLGSRLTAAFAGKLVN